MPFGCNSRDRASVTPAKRGKGAQPKAFEEEQEKTPVERHTAMSWAQRLKRVFGIDIETCPACGGALRIIACIEDPSVIKKILSHLDAKDACAAPCRLPPLGRHRRRVCSDQPPPTRPTPPALTRMGVARQRLA